MRGALCALAASWLLGCSLVKLSDDITQGRCETHEDCDVLNTESALDEDPCTRWQCDQRSQLCTYAPLDLDGDGQSPATVEHDGETFTCERNPERQDCEDGDENRTRGGLEICDGTDNDCDGHTDEGALSWSAEPALQFEGSESVTQVSYAREAESGAFAIGYSLEQGATPRPALQILPPMLSRRPVEPLLIEGGAERPLGRQVAVAAVGGRFAYAYVELRGLARLIAGIASDDGARIAVDPELFARGVNCLAGERCIANTPAGEEPAEIPTAAPALARLDNRMVLAYLRWDGPAEPRCGTLRELAASEQPELRANLLAIGSGPTLQDLYDGDAPLPAIAIGRTSDLTAPAVAGIGRIGAIATPVGFIAAYADGEGRVVLDRLEASGDRLAVSQRGVLTIEADEPHAGVAIATGVGLAGIQVLGVAYQRGCPPESRVLFGLYRLRLSRGDGDSTVLTAEAVVEDVDVSGGPGALAPALAFLPDQSAWAVAFRDARGLRVRVIDADGALHTAESEPYLLIDTDGDDAEAVLLTPAVVPLPKLPEFADDWFAVAAHVQHDDARTPRSFDIVRVGCRGDSR